MENLLEKLRSAKKKYFIFTITFLLVLLLIGVYFQAKVKIDNNKITPKIAPVSSTIDATRPYSIPEQKIAKVGQEIIYGRDLENIISIYYSQEIASPGASLDEVKSKALTRAINDSIVLQYGRKLNLVNLTPEIFNNPNKDETQRTKTVAEIIRKLKDKEEKISGAKLAIWFHNQDITTLPFAQAEALAKKKIYDIYRRLGLGEITFQQAGQIIGNDQELEKLDKNYKGNGYSEFTDVPSYKKIFKYEQLEKIARNLKEGEISQVIRIPQEGTPLGANEEEFYAIIKVEKRENFQKGSYLDWLKKEKQTYEITIF